MWHWDQGRLEYFQFEILQRVAKFATQFDLKNSSKAFLYENTGLPFHAPPTHTAWRNYSRVFKQCLLLYEEDNAAKPTPVAYILSRSGEVTCDEYMHFLVQTTTEPSPALKGWDPNANFKFPLLFSLKYLLMKKCINPYSNIPLNEIIGAFAQSGFTGEESAEHYVDLLKYTDKFNDYTQRFMKSHQNIIRQARESLKVISQISYLHFIGGQNSLIQVSLEPDDAQNIFESITPIKGQRAMTGEREILRLSEFFSGGSFDDFFEYTNTILSNVVESGFTEGTKVKKTHVTIERNANLRKAYFQQHPTTSCNVCNLNTSKTYHWTDKILDLHHLLPLASGTRVVGQGTTFEDLVPLCPNCHRATHKFYDNWLRMYGKKDFSDEDEARKVYAEVKEQFKGHYCDA